MTYLVSSPYRIIYMDVQFELIYADDFSCYESGLLLVEDRIRSQFQTVFPFLQLADSSCWYNMQRHSNVFRRWSLRDWLRWHSDCHLLDHTLFKSPEKLGRCVSKSDLPPSTKVSVETEARTRQVLATADLAFCE